jgi:hypothetical protein
MPVKQIELEEITMIELSDDALEATVSVGATYPLSMGGQPCSDC